MTHTAHAELFAGCLRVFAPGTKYGDDTESSQSPAYRWSTHKKMFLRVAGALIKIKSDND